MRLDCKYIKHSKLINRILAVSVICSQIKFCKLSTFYSHKLKSSSFNTTFHLSNQMREFTRAYFNGEFSHRNADEHWPIDQIEQFECRSEYIGVDTK